MTEAHAPTQPRPRAPHRGANPVTLEVIQESLRRVLTSPVRVKDRHTLLDRASPDRHVNGLAHQGRVHVVGHRITHDLLSTAVQNGRQIDESGPRPDTGDVPAQLLAGLVSGEVPPEQVRALVQGLGRHRGSDFCPWPGGLQAQVTHDGTDRGTVGPHTTPLQGHLNPPVPIGAIGVLKNVLNHKGQLLPPSGRP